MIKDKLQKHTNGWIPAIVIMFVISFLANSLWSSIENYEQLQEKKRTSADYFIYQKGNEIENRKEVYTVGEFPEFKSNVTRYKPSTMIWKDTLFCDGVKYDTQIWEDYATLNKPEYDYWGYKEELVTVPRESCIMCGVAIAVTKSGYQKPAPLFCSKPFSFVE